MKAPIIVCENGDINIFQSKEDAESYMEPTDVENAEFMVFDSEGKTLLLDVYTEKGSGLFGFFGGRIKKVKIKSDNFIPENVNVLRFQLTNFLLKLNSGNQLPSSASISELIDRIKPMESD
ncbi:MAG: hypothetical protein QX199_20015 [Methylococcaceae bacterium]